MEVQYVYSKKRSEFGRQCLFSDDGPKLIENIMPNRALMDNFIIRDPSHKSVQCSFNFSEHEVNTVRVDYDMHSINHAEGGWPKDVNCTDIEQTLRFRKKIEKDETYIHTVLQLSHPMEHCIHQNNAVNIYELYFDQQDPANIVERTSSRTVNVFRDPSTPKRMVSHLSWSPDNGSRLAVTHCNLEFQRAPHNLSTQSYIWQVENPNSPELALQTHCCNVCVEYNPKDTHSLVSGLYSGQVAYWDTRRGSEPVEVSLLANSHRDPVHKVLWINSKSGAEFFSASTDGQLKWWDVRRLVEPTETLVLDLNKGEEPQLSRAMGACALEYESTIPTRFMVGTENGTVISGNRKGKTAAEKLGATFKTHLGPVYALQRNPSFVKNFLTIGDWTARIWSEDCKESSIIWTSYHDTLLTDGSWSPTRSSVFYTTRMDGTLDAWDILQQQREASISVKVCDEPLWSLQCHESGRLVAVGNSIGSTYLVEFSANLATTAKNDKALLTAMFERESRREKIIEGKMREIRLRDKTRKGVIEQPSSQPTSKDLMPGLSAQERAIVSAEKDFFTILAEEEQRVQDLILKAEKEAGEDGPVEIELSAGEDEVEEEEEEPEQVEEDINELPGSPQ